MKGKKLNKIILPIITSMVIIVGFILAIQNKQQTLTESIQNAGIENAEKAEASTTLISSDTGTAKRNGYKYGEVRNRRNKSW